MLAKLGPILMDFGSKTISTEIGRVKLARCRPKFAMSVSNWSDFDKKWENSVDAGEFRDKIGRKSATCSPNWVKFGRFWKTLTRFGGSWSNSGRIRPKSGQHWPTSAKLRQIRAMLVDIGRTSAQVSATPAKIAQPWENPVKHGQIGGEQTTSGTRAACERYVSGAGAGRGYYRKYTELTHRTVLKATSFIKT